MIEQIYLFPRLCSDNSTVIPCNVAELAFLPRLSELLLSTARPHKISRQVLEQRINCIIVQKRLAMQSMGRSMDSASEDMVDGLFFCATLTGCRVGHTPYVEAGAETSDADAEAVKPNPRGFLEGHFRKVGAGVGKQKYGAS